MSRRFINPDWKTLRKYPSDLQRAWFYIWSKADCAGVYHYDPDYFKLDLGLSECIPLETLAMLPDYQILPGDRILILNFISVEYTALKENYNPHKPAWRALAKNKLFYNSSLNQACVKLEEEEEGKEGKEDLGKFENLFAPIHPAEIHNAKMSSGGKTIKQAGLELVIEKSFDTFWNLWPRKVDKEYCKALWLRLKPPEIEKIFEVLPLHVEYYTGREWSMITTPKNWIEGKKWNDEIKIEKQNGKSNADSRANGQRTQADPGGGIKPDNSGGFGKLGTRRTNA